MFIYTKREKEGQCVSVDLPGDLLLVVSVLTWILRTRVCSTCLIPFMLTAQWFLSLSSSTRVPAVSAASLGHRGWASWLVVRDVVHTWCVCVQQILYVTDPLVWDVAEFTVFLPVFRQKLQQGKKVSVIPSPDQILLFNPRLWTFGLASRSGPGAGGWWAHRETSCWAGRFSGADRQEAAQKLWWPAFASICCSGSHTRAAWCRGLRLWIGPLGHLFWLTQHAFSFFLSFSYFILSLVHAAFLFPLTPFSCPSFIVSTLFFSLLTPVFVASSLTTHSPKLHEIVSG